MANAIAQLLPNVQSHLHSTVADNVLNRLLSDRDSNTRQLIDGYQKDALVNALKHRHDKPKLAISFKLTTEEKSSLEDVYPEYSFDFKDEAYVGHPFAAASRVCETNRLISDTLNMHDYREGVSEFVKSLSEVADYNALILSIGGNAKTHYADEFVHSCDPVLGPYDASRATLRSVGLILKSDKLSLESKKTYLYTTKYHCGMKFQDCDVKAPFAIAVQSLYDIPINDLIDSLDEKNVLTCYATIIFDGEIFLNDKGILKPLNVKYEVQRKERKINFYFSNDTSFGYQHDLDNYLSYLANPVIVSKRGTVYIKELTVNRAGVQYMRIVRGDQNYTINEVGRILYSIPFKTKDSTVEIVSFSWEYASVGSNRLRYKLRPKKLYMKKSIYECTMQYVLALNDSKFTPSQVYEYLRSATSIVVADATYVKNFEYASAEKLYDCAYAIYMHAYAKRYKNGRVLREQVEIEQKVRNIGAKTLLSKMITYFFKGGGGDRPYEFSSVALDSNEKLSQETVKDKSSKKKKFQIFQKDRTFNIPSITFKKLDFYDELHHYFFERLTGFRQFLPIIEQACAEVILESVDLRVRCRTTDHTNMFCMDEDAPNLLDALRGEVENEYCFDHLQVGDNDVIQPTSEESTYPTDSKQSSDSSSSSDISHSGSDELPIKNSSSSTAGKEHDDPLLSEKSTLDVGHVQYADETWGGLTTSCKKKIHQTKPNQGKGNCLYYSLLNHNDDIEVNQLKRDMLNSGLLDMYAPSYRDDLVKMLSIPNEWADLSVVDLYCKFSNCRVHVHDMTTKTCSVIQFGDAGPLMEIVAKPNHFERLVNPISDLSKSVVSLSIKNLSRASSVSSVSSISSDESIDQRQTVGGGDSTTNFIRTSVVSPMVRTGSHTTLALRSDDFSKITRASSQTMDTEACDESRKFFFGDHSVSSPNISCGSADGRVQYLNHFIHDFSSKYSKMKVNKCSSFKFLEPYQFEHHVDVPNNKRTLFSISKMLVYVCHGDQLKNVDKPLIDTLLIVPDKCIIDKKILFASKPEIFLIAGFVCFWFHRTGSMLSSILVDREFLSGLNQYDLTYHGVFATEDYPSYYKTLFPHGEYEVAGVEFFLRMASASVNVSLYDVVLIDVARSRTETDWCNYVKKTFGLSKFSILYDLHKPLRSHTVILVQPMLKVTAQAFVSQLLLNNTSLKKIMLIFPTLQCMKPFQNYFLRLQRNYLININCFSQLEAVHADLEALDEKSFRALREQVLKNTRAKTAWNNGHRKLDEILSLIDITPYDFLDVGAGPGGFTAALMFKYPYLHGKVHVFFDHRLRSDIRPATFLNKYTNVQLLKRSPENGYYGDLIDDEQYDYLTQNLLKNQSFDLIVADGYCDRSAAENFLLKQREIQLALMKLKFSGTFIVKLHMSPADVKLIDMLNGNFKSIHFIKPQASNPLSREFYVVAQGRCFTQRLNLQQELQDIVQAHVDTVSYLLANKSIRLNQSCTQFQRESQKVIPSAPPHSVVSSTTEYTKSGSAVNVNPHVNEAPTMSRNSSPLPPPSSSTCTSCSPSSTMSSSSSQSLSCNLVYSDCDLFSMPRDYSLAHCVSADMSMHDGIAVQFATRFKSKAELLKQKKRVGQVAILDHDSRFIYYLITKKHYYSKPTIDTLRTALRDMIDHARRNSVRDVAIPRLGCGIDGLQWTQVENLIKTLTSESDIKIHVCDKHSNPVDKKVTFSLKPLREISSTEFPKPKQHYPKEWKTSDAWKRYDYNPMFEFENLEQLSVIKRNAAREIMAIWKHTPLILNRKYQYIYKTNLSLKSSLQRPSKQMLNFLKMHVNKLQLFDLVDHKRYGNIHDYKFTYGYDGQDFVRAQITSSGVKFPSTKARWVIVSDEMEVMNDQVLYESTKTIDLSYDQCEYIVVQGVPGCGKTHYVVQNYQRGDLVLSATREGRKNLSERIAQKLDTAFDDCFTVHSYLINGGDVSYNRVWIDEANMRHFGEMVLVANKTHAKEIMLIGDAHQIPFFLRIPSIPVYYPSFHSYIEPKELLNVSYRVPQDVAYKFKDVYSTGFFSASKITHSMDVVPITNIMAVPRVEDDSVVYLTFKRSEKQEIQQKLRVKVFTVGEYQGLQSPRVNLVRLSSKSVDNIYKDRSQILVALTRHTTSLTYYTMCDYDEISDEINKLKSISMAELLTVHKSGKRGACMSKLVVRNETIGKPVESDVVADILGFSFGTLITPMIVSRVYIEEPMNFQKSPLVSQHSDYTLLQQFYDLVMPGCSVRDRRFEQYLCESIPYVLNYPTVTLNLSKHGPVDVEKRAHLRPVLRTAIAYKRLSTQRDATIGLQKRNLDKPELDGIVDEDFFIELMIERFITTFINSDSQHLFHDFINHKFLPNHASVTSWLQEQNQDVLTNIKEVEGFMHNRLYMYNLMNKRTVKPKLEPTAINEYSAVQTIAYQKKVINMIFCPIFRELMRRLIAVLKPQFIMYTNMSPEQFADEFNRRFSGNLLTTMNKLEIDVSKYDKSQDQLLLRFEIAMYRLLGLPDWLCDLWYHAHYSTILLDRLNGVKAGVIYQRKSGDASTFFGNTLVLMGILCTLFDMTSFVGVFSGDDSVLWGDRQLDEDMNSLTAEIFNLESKFFSYKYTYFCSKFLVFDGQKFHFVPDPLKLITKLGRHDLVSWEHLEEYRVSLCDLVKSYDDQSLVLPLNRAFSERYKVNVDLGQVLATINHMVHDPEEFKNLYYLLPGEILLTDPSLPNLD